MDPQHQHSAITHGPSQEMTPTLLCRQDPSQSTAAGFALAFWVFPSLKSILKQHWEKTKTSVRKANKGKIPNSGRCTLPSSTQELFANSKCWLDFQNSESLPKSSDFYGPGKELFFFFSVGAQHNYSNYILLYIEDTHCICVKLNQIWNKNSV